METRSFVFCGSFIRLLCAVGCGTGTQTEKSDAESSAGSISASSVEDHSDLSSQTESEQEPIEPSEEILALIAEKELYQPCIVHAAMHARESSEEELFAIAEEAFAAIGVEIEDATRIGMEDLFLTRGNCYYLCMSGSSVSIKTDPELLPVVAEVLNRRAEVREIIIDPDTLDHSLMTDEELRVWINANLYYKEHEEGLMLLLPEVDYTTTDEAIAAACEIFEALGVDPAPVENAEVLEHKESDLGNSVYHLVTTAYYQLSYNVANGDGTTERVRIGLYVGEENMADALFYALHMPEMYAMPNYYTYIDSPF